MFDRNNPVIADLAQLAKNSAPDILAVAIADREEDPEALLDALETRCIQNTVDGAVIRVDGGIFGVEVIDRPKELSLRLASSDTAPFFKNEISTYPLRK